MLTPDGYEDNKKRGIALNFGFIKLRLWQQGCEVIKDGYCYTRIFKARVKRSGYVHHITGHTYQDLNFTSKIVFVLVHLLLIALLAACFIIAIGSLAYIMLELHI